MRQDVQLIRWWMFIFKFVSKMLLRYHIKLLQIVIGKMVRLEGFIYFVQMTWRCHYKLQSTVLMSLSAMSTTLSDGGSQGFNSHPKVQPWNLLESLGIVNNWPWRLGEFNDMLLAEEKEGCNTPNFKFHIFKLKK